MPPASPASPLSPPRPVDLSNYHPLEVVPYFRRFAPGVARDVLYTLIWNCAIGLVFWVFAILFGGRGNFTVVSLIWNLIVANVIGYTLHALFVIGHGFGLERRARE